MPKQEHINEIADYLVSFENKTRAHKQEAFHMDCGTAHCLAGWKAFEDYLKYTQVDPATVSWKTSGYFNTDESEEYESSEIEEFIAAKTPSKNDDAVGFCCISEWIYAQRVWDLDDRDADSLFDADLTLDEMKANLRRIAESFGLTCHV